MPNSSQVEASVLTTSPCCGVLQVIGNTGSNSTGEALHATEQGFAVGMHGALQINPYYGKTSKAGLKAHFDAVIKEGPAIIYNVPSRTGQDIPDDIVQSIATHPNFLGMKECTGNERIGNYTKQVGGWVDRAGGHSCMGCIGGGKKKLREVDGYCYHQSLSCQQRVACTTGQPPFSCWPFWRLEGEAHGLHAICKAAALRLPHHKTVFYGGSSSGLLCRAVFVCRASTAGQAMMMRHMMAATCITVQAPSRSPATCCLACSPR